MTASRVEGSIGGNHESVAEICRRAGGLGPNARPLINSAENPVDLLQRLIDKELFGDAVDLVAAAMPGQEVVWWASLCALHAGGDALPAVESVALDAAVDWVLEPTEARRSTAQRASEAAQLTTPAGCAAAGAAYAGLSVPAEFAASMPEPRALAARMASGAISLSAYAAGTSDASDRFRQYLAIGIDVSRGINHWNGR